MWKWKPDVEFQYGGRLDEFNGMSSQSHVSHCRVLPLGEFTVMFPYPHARLQGAVTWQNQCHDRATSQGVRIPFAILKIVFRHIIFFCLFFNAVWALTSGGFRIVSNTLVINERFVSVIQDAAISRVHCRNSFSQLVGEEFLKYFDFTGEPLDVGLRRFLRHLTVTGDSQECDRLLGHFSHRYHQCNPTTHQSEGQLLLCSTVGYIMFSLCAVVPMSA